MVRFHESVASIGAQIADGVDNTVWILMPLKPATEATADNADSDLAVGLEWVVGHIGPANAGQGAGYRCCPDCTSGSGDTGAS